MPFVILIYVLYISTLKFAVIKGLLSENVLQLPYAAIKEILLFKNAPAIKGLILIAMQPIQ